MDLAAQTDLRTEADLRTLGSLKWTATDPGVIGAWVAEMDLPLAPAITEALQSAVTAGLTGYLPEYLDRVHVRRIELPAITLQQGGGGGADVPVQVLGQVTGEPGRHR